MSGTLVKIVAFAVFLTIGFAAVPLMLRLFLAGQRYIGNAGHPLVRMLSEHQALVVGGVWCMFAAGLAIAMPVMLRDEFFGPGPRIWLETMLAGRTQGVLVANVGMTVEEIRRRSTVPLPEAGPDGLTGSTNLIGEVVFDWEIADTGTRFERCRYYFIVTRPKGDVHVRSINVGVSPRALPRAEHDEAMRRTQERLRADGWASGRYVYRKPEQIALHGGKTSAGEGYYWLKGEALIHLEPKRVDDEQRGEDPRTAGKWILAVSLGERATSSSYEGLEFTPAPPR